MPKSAFSLLFFSASLLAGEVKYCGENVLEQPKELEEVCYVFAAGPEKSVVLKYKNGAEVSFAVVAQTSEYSKQTQVTVEGASGKQAKLTLYRHYVPGTYPGDGDNYPIALEGTAPDGTVLKVVELELR